MFRFVLTLSLGLLLFSPALAERCEGDSWCTVCTDCSRCAHCSFQGNSCGVCRRSLRSAPAPSLQPQFEYRKQDQSSVLADIDGDGALEKFVSVYWGGEFFTLAVLDEFGKTLTGSLTVRDEALRIGLPVREAQVADIDGDGKDELVQEMLGRGPNPWLEVFSWDRSFLTRNITAFHLGKQSNRFIQQEYSADLSLMGFRYCVVSARNEIKGGLQLQLKPYHGNEEFYRWSRTASARSVDGKLEFKGWLSPWTYKEIGVPPSTDGFIMPEVHFEPITESDLVHFSAKELTLLRNEIFAIHGRPFSDPELRAYFSSKSWYEPIAVFNDAYVPAHGQANAHLIGEYQRKHKLVW